MDDDRTVKRACVKSGQPSKEQELQTRRRSQAPVHGASAWYSYWNKVEEETLAMAPVTFTAEDGYSGLPIWNESTPHIRDLATHDAPLLPGVLEQVELVQNVFPGPLVFRKLLGTARLRMTAKASECADAANEVVAALMLERADNSGGDEQSKELRRCVDAVAPCTTAVAAACPRTCGNCPNFTEHLILREYVQIYNYSRVGSNVVFLAPADVLRDERGFADVAIAWPHGTVSNLTGLLMYSDLCTVFREYEAGGSCRPCPDGET